MGGDQETEMSQEGGTGCDCFRKWHTVHTHPAAAAVVGSRTTRRLEIKTSRTRPCNNNKIFVLITIGHY